jgi:protease-4
MKKFLKTVLAVICGIILFNVLLIAIFAGLATPSTPTVPAEGVLKIDMSKIVLGEQSCDTDPFTMLQGGQDIVTIGIWDAVQAINCAAGDPGIKYIYLKTDGNASGVVNASEFRKALENFRATGSKAIVSYIESPSTGSYYLSSVADKIYMTPHPGAMITINGVGSQMFFLGDLLKKFGVNVQLIRHGKYKSAGEMFTRSNASPENREQYQVMVNSMWNTISAEIAQSRGISVEDLNKAVDNLELCLPEDFLRLGLVDELYDREALENQLAVLAVADKYTDVTMIPFADYVTAKVRPGKGSNKLAVIYVDGEIVDGSQIDNVAGDRFASVIEKVRADKGVKAVVLRVNSPGGSVLASDKIKNELDRLQAVKPVVASYGSTAASGGYWISNNCEKIFSDATTLTGSIGVFGLVPDLSKAAKDVAHVGVESITSHKHGDIMGMMRPLDAAEYGYMLTGIEAVYDRFTSLVSEGRGIPKETVDAIGQGRVWTGADALGIRLVDEIGTLEDAIHYAAVAAGDSDLNNWNVKGYPAPPSAMESFFGALGGKSDGEDVLTATARRLTKPATYVRMDVDFDIK